MQTNSHARAGQPGDDKIVALLFERDDAALTAVQQRYGAFLRSFAARFLKDDRDREEAVSDALLRLWNSVPPEQPRSLPAFLTTLVRRSAIDIARRNNRVSQPPAALAAAWEELGDIPSAGNETEDAVLARELGRSISAYLKALPARSRGIFLRRYYAACSVSEIASALGISVSTVEKELKAARDGLRKHLEKEGYEI
jgi:RNA polymerase sigma-70 factor (ECF subfamily)